MELAVLQAVRDRLGDPAISIKCLSGRMKCHVYPDHTDYLLDGKQLIAVHTPTFMRAGMNMTASFGLQRLATELDRKPDQGEG